MSGLNEADRFLLEQIRQGSAEGWSQFVDRFQGRLIAYARSRSRGHSDAEDLVQDTLISFLRALPNFREESGFEDVPVHDSATQDRRRVSRPEGEPLSASGRAGRRAFR